MKKLFKSLFTISLGILFFENVRAGSDTNGPAGDAEHKNLFLRPNPADKDTMSQAEPAGAAPSIRPHQPLSFQTGVLGSNRNQSNRPAIDQCLGPAIWEGTDSFLDDGSRRITHHCESVAGDLRLRVPLPC